MSEFRIRPARPGDAEALANLGNELARLMESPKVYSAEMFVQYAFAPRPHFEVLVAESAGDLVGYALYEETFNTDLCKPGMWLHDIMVAEPARNSSAGRALMAAIAKATLERGRSSLWWGVLSSNEAARRFYARIGANDEDARILELYGESLTALAAEP